MMTNDNAGLVAMQARINAMRAELAEAIAISEHLRAERDAALAVIADVIQYLDDCARLASSPTTTVGRAIEEGASAVVGSVRAIIEATP